MNRWLNYLKKYFIPHEFNEHQPHFLREGSVVAVLVLIILIEVTVVIPSFFILPHSQFLAAVLPQALVDLTNENRVVARLPELKTNPLLVQAAELKAQDMAKRGYFSHQTPEGLSPWIWLDQVGYRFSYAGENLAVNFFDSQDVVRAWMNSPTHAANIVRAGFTEVGIGVAPGRFQGRDSLYVVQFFGRPSGELATVLPVRTLSELDGSAPLDTNAPPRLNRVLGAAVAATHFSYWQLLSIRLHTLSNRIYWALLAITILAFLVNLLTKIRIQHPHIIVNGLILILVITAVIFLNDQLFVSRIQTSYLDTGIELSQ